MQSFINCIHRDIFYIADAILLTSFFDSSIFVLVLLSHITYTMIQGAKRHAFHACMKKHDLLARKTPKSSHFS